MKLKARHIIAAGGVLGSLYFAKPIDPVDFAKQKLQGPCYDAAHLVWDGVTEQGVYPNFSTVAQLPNVLTGNQEGCRKIVGEITANQLKIDLAKTTEVEKEPITIYPLVSGRIVKGKDLPSIPNGLFVSPPLYEKSGCYVYQQNGSQFPGEKSVDETVYSFPEIFLTRTADGVIRAESGSQELQERVSAGTYEEAIRMYWREDEIANLSLIIGETSPESAYYTLGLSDTPPADDPEGSSLSALSGKHRSFGMDLLNLKLRTQNGGNTTFYGAIGQGDEQSAYYINFDGRFLLSEKAFDEFMSQLNDQGIQSISMMDPVGFGASNGENDDCKQESYFLLPD